MPDLWVCVNVCDVCVNVCDVCICVCLSVCIHVCGVFVYESVCRCMPGLSPGGIMFIGILKMNKE